MQTRMKVSGRPIQPMLVTLPLGLFVCATTFDVAHVGSGFDFLAEVGYWTTVVALVAAALTTVTGLIDLWDVPAGVVRRMAVTFNLANIAMAALFLCVCLVRAAAPNRTVNTWHLAVEVLALAAGVFGARLGTQLVQRFDEARREPTSFGALRSDRRPVTDGFGRATLR